MACWGQENGPGRGYKREEWGLKGELVPYYKRFWMPPRHCSFLIGNREPSRRGQCDLSQRLETGGKLWQWPRWGPSVYHTSPGGHAWGWISEPRPDVCLQSGDKATQSCSHQIWWAYKEGAWWGGGLQLGRVGIRKDFSGDDAWPETLFTWSRRWGGGEERERETPARRKHWGINNTTS